MVGIVLDSNTKSKEPGAALCPRLFDIVAGKASFHFGLTGRSVQSTIGRDLHFCSQEIAIMKVIRAQATGAGQVVSWTGFLKSKLIAPLGWERYISLTTIIPDVLSDVMNYCNDVDPQYTFRVLVPNGPTSASFDVVLTGNNFKITCSKRLMRGWFPINLFAAEFGSNYDVIFSIMAEESIESHLAGLLKANYIAFEL